MRTRICIAVIGDVRRDSRCLRIARSLAEKHDTAVFSLGNESAEHGESGVRFITIPRADPGSLRVSLKAFWREHRSKRLGEADLWFAGDLYSLPLAAGASNRDKAGLIFDSRELYPHIAALAGKPLRRSYWRWTEAWHARHADAIFTVNDSIAEMLRKRYRGKRIEVLRNYPDEFPSRPPVDLKTLLDLPRDHVLLLSQGGIQRGRGGELCIRALSAVDGCSLIFLGSGEYDNRLRALAESAGVSDRVRFLSAVPADELPSWTAAADIGMCVIENIGSSYYLSLPNKLFEYAAAGLPIIASAFPEIERVVAGNKMGCLVDPSDEDGFVSTLRRLVADGGLRKELGANASAASKKFRWRNESDRLLETVDAVLENVATRRKR